jgi:ribosomal protein S10
MVAGVVRTHQDNIEIPGKAPVLKAVVQKMETWSGFAFREHSRLVAIFSNNDGHIQAARD